ncbi:hypothetical protein DVY91_01545 [Enterococcus faecalis]|jgi:hypothetical protein|uniref:hypothetical protein n=1 Tax=Bacilli TaxID=91061 RepID=UPI0001B6FBB8|nr:MULTISPECIES: hypothetical protein [Bacilli]AUC58738.1 hypothetical protein CG806_10375 [Enterococcus faecalis ARO1/DG]EAC2894602.1 hypothetical protein [Listeria monocytogenes]EAC4040272.1 hypothetical protein [Listeria monocytogenes]EAC5666140.1 hypothetical protein [Listeria monocytogenes]EAC6981960.1 hypothetical protein [Listeria monocytogenes]
MNISEEKKVIYHLMQAIMTERRQLTEQYFDLKERLNELSQTTTNVHENNEYSTMRQNHIKKEDIENAKYLLAKKEGKSYLPYSKIALQISHLLKSHGVPLSNKQIYEKLINDFQLSINYSNLTNNILPRMNSDSSINVEKVTRGYWQYKLNN